MINHASQSSFNSVGDQPLVSIIVPVYNAEETIVETLESIFSQDYKNIEVIIINDGSTDDTARIIEPYKNVAKIINQANAGSAVARTQGIKQANGKYIAFIDADDLWVPWKISTQVVYLERHQDVGVVFNAWIELRSPSERLPQTQPDCASLEEIDEGKSGWLYTRLLMDCVVHTSAVVMSKAVCDQVGAFDPNLRRGQDYDYWLRVSQLTKITKLKSVLSAYRIHSNSITNKAPLENYEAMLLNKAIKSFGLGDNNGNKVSKSVMNQRMVNSWKNFCWQTYRAGQYSKSLQSAINLVKYRPFWYLGWTYLLASLAKIIFSGFSITKPTLPPHLVD